MTRRSAAGFTLIEALVALSIVAISLAAIGSLAAFNIRGTARLERQLALMETTRTVLATLSTRPRSSSGIQSGEMDGHSWQIRSRSEARQGSAGGWTPRTLSVVVRSPNGREFQVETIGLRRLPADRG